MLLKITQSACSKILQSRFAFAATKVTAKPGTSKYYMQLEDVYGCHNYHPIPVVLDKGQGIYVWDVEGKRYMDFLSAYSAVNQGHLHPRIQKVANNQMKKLTLTSRAFYSKNLGLIEKYLCELFGYDKALLMNTGCEGTESAVKFARRWAYDVKGVPDNEARVLFAIGNFWGRSIAACGSSEDPYRHRRFGPYKGLNFDLVEYNNLEALDQQLATSPNYAAYVVEPIQGEMGVLIPQQGYMKKVHEICKKHKVLLVADEIQTGLGRTGKMLACEHDDCKPDMLVLGKAMAGGFYPVSALLASNEVMLCIKPGEHGSTYGGNALGTAICMESLKILTEEKLIQNSAKMGKMLLDGLKRFQKDYIKDIRGRGLFCAIEFQENAKFSAWDLCLKMKDAGLLAKPTHDTTIRFSPPLVINEKQVKEALKIVGKSLKALEKEKM